MSPRRHDGQLHRISMAEKPPRIEFQLWVPANSAKDAVREAVEGIKESEKEKDRILGPGRYTIHRELISVRRSLAPQNTMTAANRGKKHLYEVLYTGRPGRGVSVASGVLD